MLPKSKGGLIGLALVSFIAVIVTTLLLMGSISQVMDTNQGYPVLAINAVLWMIALLTMVASFNLVRDFKPADKHPDS